MKKRAKVSSEASQSRGERWESWHSYRGGCCEEAESVWVRGKEGVQQLSHRGDAVTGCVLTSGVPERGGTLLLVPMGCPQ